MKSSSDPISDKKYSPFKDVNELKKEIIAFANKNRAIVQLHSKRISDYFEMTCYNFIVEYYEKLGFNTSVANLQKNEFRYKCSPAGIHSNFSYFIFEKQIENEKIAYEFHHNLSIQSAHDNNIFCTPDMVVIKNNSAQFTSEYYASKKRFSFVDNSNMITFFEAKHFTPYPELLFNFIGILNELKIDFENINTEQSTDLNIAPSLIISGKENNQTKRIKISLERRYKLNIIFDIFFSKRKYLSKNPTLSLQKL